MPISVIASFKRYVWRPSTIVVLALVLGFNVLVEFDWVRKYFPLIEKGQLEFHRILCWTMPRPLTAKWVRTVQITNQDRQIGGITDRNFLATLINQARTAPPEVIILDFKFQAPKGKPAGEDLPGRASQDQALTQAILGAAHDGNTVVVPCWLDRVSSSDWKRLPDFFEDSDFLQPDVYDQGPLLRNQFSPHPARVRIGNINLPKDARQIPLVSRTVDKSDPCQTSLALAAAEAHEDAIDLWPRTREKKIIARAIEDRDFVVGSFIPSNNFQPIAAEDLFRGDKVAIESCRGRIILVGGNWKEDGGNGGMADTYNTPAGSMPGMYIHANYIEALLDDRYERIVPLAFALTFDLVVGMLLYIYFHKAVDMRGKLKVLGVFLLPLLASYVIFANFNWYLDFILPLMACFAHLLFELGRSYHRLSHLEAEQHRNGVSE